MTKGERIKAAREAAGLTQEQLGRLCHTTKQTIYKYESGIVTNIPIDRLVSIAQALSVSAEYIAGWENDLLYSAAKDAVLSKEFNSLPEKDRIAALDSIKKSTTLSSDVSELSDLQREAWDAIRAMDDDTLRAFITLARAKAKE